jgi:glycosyltransferase involved in cell wall biosynthesis
MQLPLITVGITCFNAADTIGRAIESAMKQEWPNKEIIVVDDASTDGSGAMLLEMARHRSGLRVFRCEINQGVAAVRNRIVAEARGEFVAFFDDDDESREDRLTKQWQRLTDYERLHHADLVLCYSNRYVVRAGQTKPDHLSMAIGRVPPEPNGLMVASFVLGHVSDTKYVWGRMGSGTLMARRRTFVEIGEFDPNFRRFEERDLAVRGDLQGEHFISVNEPLITQYKTASVEKTSEKRLEYRLKLTRKHKSYLLGERRYLSSIAMAHARFHEHVGHRWRHRLFAALTYCFLPPSVLAAKLASRATSWWRVSSLGKGFSHR